MYKELKPIEKFEYKIIKGKKVKVKVVEKWIKTKINTDTLKSNNTNLPIFKTNKNKSSNSIKKNETKGIKLAAKKPISKKEKIV
jgi:vancomycin resistance protein YoaR